MLVKLFWIGSYMSVQHGQTNCREEDGEMAISNIVIGHEVDFRDTVAFVFIKLLEKLKTRKYWSSSPPLHVTYSPLAIFLLLHVFVRNGG